MRKIFFVVILLFVSLLSFSQMVTVEAKLDSNMFLIGDQVKLHLIITKDNKSKINFPILPDSLAQSVEIVDRLKPDTIFKDNKIVKLNQTFLITSFDSGTHTIPKIAFELLHDSLTDTIFTDSLLFTVNTLKVDTASKKIYDIKVPFDEPFSIKEIIEYLLWGLLILAVIILGIYIYYKLKKKEPLIKVSHKPSEPPHVIALKELDALKEKKLWQNNHIKKFHTELTDILRNYVENKFDIQAKEMTSYEVIEKLNNEKYVTEENILILRKILTLADFVKFAKMQPLPDENDSSLKMGYLFVNQTKPNDIEINNNLPNNDQGGLNV